ncbi:MAG: NAD(P)/FAD-dependent oxidoreductase [Planctomycetota bacterium]|nr:NAD(P)/FAD-dependent oxidoreductase [Planctomycetota bacterium]
MTTTPPAPSSPDADIIVVGCGAAGLFAAIWAKRAAPHLAVIALDGAARLGAKILVAGGGRCNVTHHAVDESAYAGSSRNSVKKVLRQFDVPATVAFFRDLGVELKREETGKLFPTTDDAHSVLNAMLDAAAEAQVGIIHPWRVARIEQHEGDFVVHREPAAAATEGGDGSAPAPSPGARPRNVLALHPLATRPSLRARRLILATGGKSLPKTGSDGAGYQFARQLGHSITPTVCPALVPLTLGEHFLRSLSGVALPATLSIRSATGKVLHTLTNSLLLTHFGLSGPAALDISRFWTHARGADPGARMVVNFLPGARPEDIDRELAGATNGTVLRYLTSRAPDQAQLAPGDQADPLPERLARALCEHASCDPTGRPASLPREARKRLAGACTELALPITGDRGYLFAEVTAGGVPLAELRLETMESRPCPGLHLCGEICDVDGRIGGFNFQWAWASGYVAGKGAAALVDAVPA